MNKRKMRRKPQYLMDRGDEVQHRVRWVAMESGMMSNGEFRRLSAPWMQKELAELLSVHEAQIVRWRGPSATTPIPNIIVERFLALPPAPPGRHPEGYLRGRPKREQERVRLTPEERRRRKVEREEKYGSPVKRRWAQYVKKCDMMSNDEFRKLSSEWKAYELATLLDVPKSRVESYRRLVQSARVPNEIAERLLKLVHAKTDMRSTQELEKS